MSKPPVGFRGDSGIGALTGLSGVGQQDTFLYKPVGNEYSYSEYSQSTPYYRFYRPTETRFLGEEIRHVLRPKEMGDLLTGLMLKFNFPPTTGATSCIKNLGLSMIRKVDLIVDGMIIQSLKGEWMSMYESMYSISQERSDVLNTMYNLGKPYDTQPSLIPNDTTQNLFFPLPFFFNRHYVDSKIGTSSFRAPLPICAMHNSDIMIVIQFRSLAEIVSNTDGFAVGADLTEFKFVTQEISLTDQERFMFKSVPQRYPIEKINAEEIELDASLDAKYRYYFNSAYSCRAIFWTFKNFISGYNPIFYNPIISSTITTLNKTDRNEIRKSLFLKEYQAYVHDYHNDGSFYGYSFAEQPLQVVSGDYEFRAPRPQSAYIDMLFTTVAAGYTLWSATFASDQQNYTVQDSRILLNTSVGLGGDAILKSLRVNEFGYLRTNTVRVGIPGTSYTSTENDGPPPVEPYKMRFEPWTTGYIKITADARTNINTFVPSPELFLLTMYYLSTNTFVAENGRGRVEENYENGVVEGKFNSLDTDGSGFIEAIESDVTMYDKDGDGKVSFAEFKEIEEV